MKMGLYNIPFEEIILCIENFLDCGCGCGSCVNCSCTDCKSPDCECKVSKKNGEIMLDLSYVRSN